MSIKRTFDLLDHVAKKHQKNKLLSKKINGAWESYSTNDLIEKSNAVSLGLLEKGIKKDDKIAIVSYNRCEWVFLDFGIQQLGAVSVPIYPTITEDDFAYIFKDSESKIVFVETEELYHKVKSAAKNVPSVEAIYTIEQVNGASNWNEIVTLGNNKDAATLAPYKDAISPDDLLTLIYTSGTTGNPKGVMLTHNNLVSNVTACIPLLPVDETCDALSFLPMCHVFERMMLYLYLSKGVSINYAESIETIGENMKECHPHFFTCVPRLLEKVYDKIYAKGLELTGIKRHLFFWALALGHQFEVGKDMGFWYNFQLKIARKLIFSKWKEALGGNVRAIVSGSAALQPRLARVFWAAGIPILEGYGLTETSPVISVNRFEPKDHKIGTIGPIISGIQVKISNTGEILTKGPHIMKGYYNKPEATAEAIDAEGWFHTGDNGEWVDNKYLKITGRQKEVFKTSGGKYIIPQALENKFKESIFIEQIMVIGENQKCPGALIVPSFDALKEYCKHKEIPYTTDAEMVKHPAIIEKFNAEADKLNESFAQYEKIKLFAILPELWTIDGGELTPTMKVKRKVVKEKYKAEINALYGITE